MENSNWYILFISALVPLLVGFIWYHPKVMGTAWMKSSGMTPEQGQGMNMPLVFGLTYLFGLFLSSAMMIIVIHQFSVGSVLANDMTNPEVKAYLADFMTKYGQNFRSFKHGMLHGAIETIFFVLPVLAVVSMFERRSAKYIAIHVAYWFITLMLMGGIICQWM